ncbi:putative O-methyltransferase YrrM [Neolewinella xylanilytica]|uniref:Putative O-methyltransferase YrrM n=1 Tax=Neolewinella xylanilytica TaxID=1514080 RepID=A0A2S6I3A4_9BACT|nr:O-methyltransferase [Neolewinella xylanilytica]PPK85549.1 putative O-methyltransferase YrrM [Neolewinella xylanilytica]
MRDLFDPLFEYAESVSGPVPSYLHEVERQTYLKTLAPQMMSGRLQGRVLALLSKLVRPRTALEIGTFTAYGTLCLAEGLREDGVLHTIEGDPERAALAERHIAGSPFHDRVKLHVGDAGEILTNLQPPFDLIFLDGDKRGYPDHYRTLVDRLTPGGLLIADNVLWDGKTANRGDDRVANRLRTYNTMLRDDPRVEVTVLPLRDGLSIARKRL